MDNKELNALQELQSTVGYQVFQNRIEDIIKEFSDLNNIPDDQITTTEIIGRRHAVNLFKKVLSDLGVASRIDTAKNNTYE